MPVTISRREWWIDRDGYREKRRKGVEALLKIDPDAYEKADKLLMEECYESSADVDNFPEVMTIKNQTCETCGHYCDYDNYCWNCRIVIIKGRGNWIPKGD